MTPHPLSPADARLFRAVEFAARAHRGQFRKVPGGIPYLIHPLGVAAILAGYGCGPDLVAAGVLHDTIEDTPTTRAQLARRFGARVAWLVEQASEDDRLASWETRKQQTLDHLETAETDVLLVAQADKLDNVRSIQAELARLGEKTFWKSFRRPKAAQRWYYTGLGDIFLRRLTTEPGRSMARAYAGVLEKVFPGWKKKRR